MGKTTKTKKQKQNKTNKQNKTKTNKQTQNKTKQNLSFLFAVVKTYSNKKVDKNIPWKKMIKNSHLGLKMRLWGRVCRSCPILFNCYFRLHFDQPWGGQILNFWPFYSLRWRCRGLKKHLLFTCRKRLKLFRCLPKMEISTEKRTQITPGKNQKSDSFPVTPCVDP